MPPFENVCSYKTFFGYTGIIFVTLILPMAAKLDYFISNRYSIMVIRTDTFDHLLDGIMFGLKMGLFGAKAPRCQRYLRKNIAPAYRTSNTKTPRRGRFGHLPLTLFFDWNPEKYSSKKKRANFFLLASFFFFLLSSIPSFSCLLLPLPSFFYSFFLLFRLSSTPSFSFLLSSFSFRLFRSSSFFLLFLLFFFLELNALRLGPCGLPSPRY